MFVFKYFLSSFHIRRLVCFFKELFSFIVLIFSQEILNLKSQVQKQKVFEEELAANKIRLNNIQKTGQEMIDSNHYASDKVADRLREVDSLWTELQEATEQKG